MKFELMVEVRAPGVLYTVTGPQDLLSPRGTLEYHLFIYYYDLYLEL